MLIYLRHGDDHGGKGFRHDRSLNSRGKRKARKKAQRLIKKYGHPNRVYVSPFKRAQETLAAMALNFTRPVEIHQDARLAKHFGDKRKGPPKLSPETCAALPHHVEEDKDTFHSRISAHAKDLQALASNRVVWCITHQAVIKRIGKHFKAKIPSSIDFLDHVIMTK